MEKALEKALTDAGGDAVWTWAEGRHLWESLKVTVYGTQENRSDHGPRSSPLWLTAGRQHWGDRVSVLFTPCQYPSTSSV